MFILKKYMFRLEEITGVVSGRLLSGSPQRRIGGVSIDSRTIKRGELFIAIKGKRFDGHKFIRDALKKGAGAVVSSRKCQPASCGVTTDSIGFIAVSDTRKALAKLAGFHRRKFNIAVIAVTGSNGKTTVKDMLTWILSSRMNVLSSQGTQNNDIGVPLTLLRLNSSHNIAVLELGTNHFGEIAYLADIVQPNIGIITNIGPTHLEYLKSPFGVYKEKISLLSALKSPKIAVLNADDPWLSRLKNNKKIFTLIYGVKNKCDFSATAIKRFSNRYLEFLVNSKGVSGKLPHENSIRLNTIGYANIYNALAAIAAARILGYNYKLLSRRLGAFVFPPGRLKFTKLKGLFFIDDTYNANPVSLSEALGILSELKVNGRRILVMGDMLELGSSKEAFHRRAAIQIARTCDTFISVGSLSRLAANRAVKLGLSKESVFSCRDSREAGSLLFKTIKPDCRDLILVKGSRSMKMEEILNSARK